MTTGPIRTRERVYLCVRGCVCVCGGGAQFLFFIYFYFFNPSCTVTGARHPVIGQALWRRRDGTILTLGPPSACPDKGFFLIQEELWTCQRAKEPDVSKQVLRQFSGHRSYCQSYLVLAVKPSLT